MTWLRVLYSRIHGLFADDARVSEEIETHIELLAADYRQQGLSAEKALAAARRELGGATQTLEACREQRRLPGIDSITQDLRYTFRQLCAHPGFAATAILSLALGIGANAAIFQVLDTVVLRTLPVPKPEQLVSFSQIISYPLFRYMAEQQKSVQGIFVASALSKRNVTIGGRRLDRKSDGRVASGNYFRLLGVSAQIGRVFAEADDQPSSEPVAVISDSFWRRELDHDAAVLGRTLEIKGVVATIIGVTRPDFFGECLGESPDFWIPIHLVGRLESELSLSPAALWLAPLARLRPDIPRAQAEAGLGVLFTKQLGKLSTFRTDRPAPRLQLWPASRGRGALHKQFTTSLWLLMALVGIVLLLACCNLANLLLARATARTHEVGVRLAMGAPRGRLIRQFLTESLVLSVIGGLIGIALAVLGSRQLIALAAAGESWHLDINFGWRLVAFTAFLSAATVSFFGLIPAFSATKVKPKPTLQDNQRTSTGNRERRMASRAFLVAQVAISLVLVAGAMLLARSFWKLTHQDFGYHPNGVLTASLDFDEMGGFLRSVQPEFGEALYQRIQSIPGIRSAALSVTGPLGTVQEDTLIALPERPPQESDKALLVFVSAHYFETMGIPIIAGRSITQNDRKATPPVAVISETAAHKLFGASNPVGRSFTSDRLFHSTKAIEIVGVAHDVRYANPRDPFRMLVFIPISQNQYPSSPVIAINAINPGKLGNAVLKAIQDMGPGIGIYEMRTLDETLTYYLRQERLLAWLSGAFGALALILAGVGMYGVIAYGVEQRTREIGVRIALGAQRAQVQRLLLWEVALMLSLGFSLGLAAIFMLGKFLKATLYELTPQDPIALAVAAVLLGGIAMAAAYFPARRASHLDPMIALRQE
jgi:predicted permease